MQWAVETSCEIVESKTIFLILVSTLSKAQRFGNVSSYVMNIPFECCFVVGCFHLCAALIGNQIDIVRYHIQYRLRIAETVLQIDRCCVMIAGVAKLGKL